METLDSERVLVLAPTRADAELSRSILTEASLACHICTDLSGLERELGEGAGAILLTEEVFAAGDVRSLVEAVRDQPPWSDISILLLSANGDDSPLAARAMESFGNVTVLERPVRVTNLISALRTAIRARRRQYELRDHIEALRRSESNLSDFFENANVGLHWAGPDGIILRANQAELDLLGYDREEYVGHRIADFYADQEVIGDILKRLADGEKLHDYPAQLRCKDGSIKGVLISSSVYWEQGKFIHTRCFTLDVTDRYRAEESLQRSRQQLRLVIDALPAVVTYIDRETRFRFFNRTLCEWFGLDPDSISGRKAVEILGESAYEKARPGMEHAFSGQPVYYEAEIDYRYGGKRAVEVSYIPDIHPDGTVEGYVGLIQDITERKRAEKDKALYAAIVTSSDDAIISKTLDGMILSWNAGAERLFGYTASEAMGRSIMLIIPPDKHDEEGSILERLRRGERIDHFETTRLSKRGRPIDISLTISPIYDSNGQVIGASKAARDITSRKRAEETLRMQSERLRLLWEAASMLLTTEEPDVMMGTLFARIAPHFGLDAYVNFMVNEAGDALRLESCTGIPEEEVRKITRMEFGEAVSGDVALHRQSIVATHIQQSDDPKVQLVKGFGIRAYACNPLMAEDRLLGTLSFASRRKDQFDADELEFLETICHYITVAYERARLIRELQETDRRKDEFLATLAHELRNPLAPIRNALHIMRLTGSDGAAIERARLMMERQLGQLVRLIDDLLDVSRITRGKLELRKERIELSDVINNAIDTARPLIEASGHELTVTSTPQPVYLDADPVRLAQVFSNLLNNAAKYTDRGGRIWLTATHREKEVTVTVRDTGVGIPAEALPSIFDMFTQVDQSLEKSQGGLGIGLTLVKRLVEMHGGTVEVRSEGEGKGAEFTARLPTVSVVSGRKINHRLHG